MLAVKVKSPYRKSFAAYWLWNSIRKHTKVGTIYLLLCPFGFNLCFTVVLIVHRITNPMQLAVRIDKEKLNYNSPSSPNTKLLDFSRFPQPLSNKNFYLAEKWFFLYAKCLFDIIGDISWIEKRKFTSKWEIDRC